MVNVTTLMEVLSVTAEMATYSMEHIVKVHIKALVELHMLVPILYSLDVDECAEETHDCHVMSNATCVDTDGSFYCNCTEGFIGNGTFCDGNRLL